MKYIYTFTHLHIYTLILFTAALLMQIPVATNAQTITVPNEDGVELAYNFINDGTELEVTKNSSETITGKVVIPEKVIYEDKSYKVTRIGDYAFSSNKNIAELIIPNTVTCIGKSSFYGCENMETCILSNTLTTIGESAFEQCKRLSKCSFPKSLEKIESFAFQGTNLDMVVFPEGFKEIGSDAFSGSPYLLTVVCFMKNPPKIPYSAFDENTYENGTLYVPNGTYSKYRYTNYWSNFLSNIKTGVPVGIKGIKSKAKEVKNEYYSIDGRKLYVPEKGINIINGEKVLVK